MRGRRVLCPVMASSRPRDVRAVRRRPGAFLIVAAALAAQFATAGPAAASTLTSVGLQRGSEPEAVAFDAGGNAWVTGLSGTGRPALFQVTPAGAVARHDVARAGTVRPQGVIRGEDGLLYACVPADDGANRRSAIVQVDP